MCSIFSLQMTITQTQFIKQVVCIKTMHSIRNLKTQPAKIQKQQPYQTDIRNNKLHQPIINLFTINIKNKLK